MRHPAGGLGLVSVSSGEWLAGGMRTLANLREGAALTYNSSGDRLDNRLSVSRGDGGEITVSILGTGFALGAEDGTVCLCEGGSYEAVWYAEWSGGEADGIVISLRNISDEYALPEFYSSYILSRSLLNMNSSVTQYAYITERDPSIDTSVDMHTASTGLGFVETYAVVLFETVDRAEVSLAELSQGALIKYSVMCTNLYNELHEMNLTVPIPGNGDADGTALAESAMVNVVSIHAEGDSGSEVTVSSVADAVSAGEITAHSVLKPGETVTVTYEAAVSGAAPGNVLRNSAVQEDAFGTERSNRTQTVITGLDETAHRMTLSAGGGGAGTFVILGVLFAALAGFFGVTGVRAF
ncbi:MAG: hypothetical protein Q4G47_03615 [Lachnospiraceae bacterium]|nr:hypothetical protein [Lachnospiraceae bacterium]